MCQSKIKDKAIPEHFIHTFLPAEIRRKQHRIRTLLGHYKSLLHFNIFVYIYCNYTVTVLTEMQVWYLVRLFSPVLSNLYTVHFYGP